MTNGKVDVMCLKKYVLNFLVFSLYLFYQNKIYMLFTKLEGRTGELLPEIITVRTEVDGPLAEVCAVKTEDNIFPVSTDLCLANKLFIFLFVCLYFDVL